MLIRLATLLDIPYIDHLRKQEGEALGFIPLRRYEMEISGERHGSIIVCEENGDLVGFVYATHNSAGVTHIQQVAVQEDARRMDRASALVLATQRRTDWLMSCRCAAELESTHFWNALGFKVLDEVAPKSGYGRWRDKATLPTRRKRTILRFQKEVGGLWQPSSGLPKAPNAVNW